MDILLIKISWFWTLFNKRLALFSPKSQRSSSAWSFIQPKNTCTRMTIEYALLSLMPSRSVPSTPLLASSLYLLLASGMACWTIQPYKLTCMLEAISLSFIAYAVNMIRIYGLDRPISHIRLRNIHSSWDYGLAFHAHHPLITKHSRLIHIFCGSQSYLGHNITACQDLVCTLWSGPGLREVYFQVQSMVG